MHLVAYAILCYLALGIQVGLQPFLRMGGAAPNLVLLVVIFISLNAPRQSAMLGSFVLGLFQDMLTLQTPGVFALSYGIISLLIVNSQTLMFRDHPVTHLSMAFSSCIVLGVIQVLQQLIQGWLYAPPRSGDGLLPQRISVLSIVYITLLTTALSPFVLGVLQRLRWAFGFRAAHRQRI